jgi:hypothetical protein
MALTHEDKAWIRNSFGEFRTEVKADIERFETSLLTAFHKWASPADARIRTHNSAIHTIDLEIEAIKDRLTKLERPPN